MTRPTPAVKRARFRELHQSGCFVLPNPWDAGSAKLLEMLGFKALATTSAGHAWSCARADGQIPRAQALEHMRYMAALSDLPVNADFESGFAATLDELAESVRLAVDTGVAGLSIEDATGEASAPLRDPVEAAERIRVARTTIDRCGGDALLVGRAENFIVGRPDLDDAIRRLQTYAEAGADCLYAPGLRSRDEIRTVAAALAPKPVNVLVGWDSPLSVDDLAELGVRRISVGGALARSAWSGFLQAARMIAEQGRFDGFAGTPSGAELNSLFRSGSL